MSATTIGNWLTKHARKYRVYRRRKHVYEVFDMMARGDAIIDITPAELERQMFTENLAFKDSRTNKRYGGGRPAA